MAPGPDKWGDVWSASQETVGGLLGYIHGGRNLPGPTRLRVCRACRHSEKAEAHGESDQCDTCATYNPHDIHLHLRARLGRSETILRHICESERGLLVQKIALHFPASEQA
jgi:hypothetical protein